MKKVILKRMLLAVCSLSLLMVPVMCFAALPEEPPIYNPNELSRCNIAFEETSETSAEFTVNATTVLMPTYLTVKVTLQSATLGSSSFSDVAGEPALTKTVRNSRQIQFEDEFPISPRRDYRIKVQITDDCTGQDITTTEYKLLTR